MEGNEAGMEGEGEREDGLERRDVGKRLRKGRGKETLTGSTKGVLVSALPGPWGCLPWK